LGRAADGIESVRRRQIFPDVIFAAKLGVACQRGVQDRGIAGQQRGQRRNILLGDLDLSGGKVGIEEFQGRGHLGADFAKQISHIRPSGLHGGQGLEHFQGSPLKAMRRHCAAMNRRLVDIGRRSAIGRVAQLILEIEDRLGERDQVRDGAFHFPMRQEHMADALGLTTVYVNRTLDRLRKEGVIDFKRDRMKIINRALLLQTAEEE
jgi:Crp-like helix-turn-helix protein